MGKEMLFLNDLKKVAFRGGTNLFLRHLLGFTINFGGGIVLARILGPGILGMYFISYTLFLIVRGLIDFGVQANFIRQLEDPTKVDLKTAFTLQQFIGITSLVLMIFVAAPVSLSVYKQKEVALFIISAGIGAYFYCWHCIPVSLLERKFEYRKVGIIEVSEIAVFNLVSIICAIKGYGIAGLFAGNILRGLLPAVISSLYKKFFPSIARDIKSILELIKTVYPVLLSNLSVYLIMLAPPVIIGSMCGTEALGISQLAYSMLGSTTIVATIFQRIALTSFSRLQTNAGEFNNAVSKSLRLLAMVYLPVVFGIVSFSAWWIPLLYGEKWKGMESVVLIAVIPISLAGLLSIINSALISKGQFKLVLKQNLLNVIVYWLSMSMLARRFSAKAVPLAHLIAVLISSYLFIYGYKKYCGTLDYSFVATYFLFSILLLGSSFFLIAKGLIIVSIILWVVFILYSGLLLKRNIPFTFLKEGN